MSSKKVASKDSKSKKAPAKAPAKSAAKPAAKAAAKAPAKKPAEKPAKKAAPAAKKPAPAPVKKAPAKSAAKPAPKAEAKKPVTKESPKASNAKKAPAAKPVAAEKKVAKSTAKPVAAKPVEKVAAKPKAADKVTKAVPVAKKPAPAAVKAPAKEEGKKKVVPVEPPAKVQEEVVAAAPVAAEDKGDVKKKNAPDYAYAVLLQGVKRLSKTIMFVKVDESEDRSNKKKMSSDVKNLDMKPTSPIRHKASLAEETQEELTERILKELEEQNRLFEREAATQMCTRCNRNLVSPEFWVDKHLGFCEECAAILKLGQSKEARKVEYQLGAMDGDSLDEEDDDIIGPDADDLKAAEEDLAEMDD